MSIAVEQCAGLAPAGSSAAVSLDGSELCESCGEDRAVAVVRPSGLAGPEFLCCIRCAMPEASPAELVDLDAYAERVVARPAAGRVPALPEWADLWPDLAACLVPDGQAVLPGLELAGGVW